MKKEEESRIIYDWLKKIWYIIIEMFQIYTFYWKFVTITVCYFSFEFLKIRILFTNYESTNK